jgi:hypothetical protein
VETIENNLLRTYISKKIEKKGGRGEKGRR